MPFPQASCWRGFSQSGFTSRFSFHPSGGRIPLENALLVERGEDDRVNLLLILCVILQKLQQEQQNSWNGLG